MIRNLKTLGVAFCAMLALTAVMASAASAEKEYTAASYPTTGTATSALGNDVFTTEGGSVECAGHFEGTLSEASNHLTVKPKYTECKAFGFLSATVSMGSCDYTFETPKTVAGGGTHEFTASVKVICTNSSEPIKIVAATCEAQVHEQTPGGHVIITIDTNTPASPDDATVRATVTEIGYTVTKDGFGCPFNGTGTKTGATYTQDKEITMVSTNGKSLGIS